MRGDLLLVRIVMIPQLPLFDEPFDNVKSHVTGYTFNDELILVLDEAPDDIEQMWIRVLNMRGQVGWMTRTLTRTLE